MKRHIELVGSTKEERVEGMKERLHLAAVRIAAARSGKCEVKK